MSEAGVPRPQLFTIGHSNHEMPTFLSLLTRHDVTLIADVRSKPFSRFHRQFNREILAESLKQAGIGYLFLGLELGARREERESYRDGQAAYDLIRRLPTFALGLARVKYESAFSRVALLCAEKDPLTCHRTILLCRELRSEVLSICHILSDGTIERHDDVEARLLEMSGMAEGNLFQNRATLIEHAYDLQARRIAYKETKA